ncbi:hypothetical protein G5I_07447 [Acromyrmex echinatior]|uniref:Uncharacterized protein n=1 Tax=Acromyrmex echinatior TaxID=103372 RepID=F4WNU1_ACREC|nr:hypothetical protein G5I_07447 [Acromyrmex echinatior]
MKRVWKDGLDSISQVYARRRTLVSRTHLFSPGIWVNVRRDAVTPVPLDSANVGPTFWVKELNPFDPGLDLVRSQYSREVNARGDGDGKNRNIRSHLIGSGFRQLKWEGVDPKEEGVGILLREEEGEGIVPREEEGNEDFLDSGVDNRRKGEWPRRSVVSEEHPKGSRRDV